MICPMCSIIDSTPNEKVQARPPTAKRAVGVAWNDLLGLIKYLSSSAFIIFYFHGAKDYD